MTEAVSCTTTSTKQHTTKGENTEQKSGSVFRLSLSLSLCVSKSQSAPRTSGDDYCDRYPYPEATELVTNDSRRFTAPMFLVDPGDSSLIAITLRVGLVFRRLPGLNTPAFVSIPGGALRFSLGGRAAAPSAAAAAAAAPPPAAAAPAAASGPHCPLLAQSTGAYAPNDAVAAAAAY